MYRIQMNEWCYNLFNCPLSIELVVKVTFASNLQSPRGSQQLNPVISSFTLPLSIHFIFVLSKKFLCVPLPRLLQYNITMYMLFTIILHELCNFMVKSWRVPTLHFTELIHSKLIHALSKRCTFISFSFSLATYKLHACLHTHEHSNRLKIKTNAEPNRNQIECCWWLPMWYYNEGDAGKNIRTIWPIRVSEILLLTTIQLRKLHLTRKLLNIIWFKTSKAQFTLKNELQRCTWVNIYEHS